MRRLTLTTLVVAACGSLVEAQTLRVEEIVTVAREADPRRFSEPHLAVHPLNPNHFLATSFIASVTGTVEELHAAQRCATFATIDGGATWRRHEFALRDCGDPQVAILPDGQAVFVALAEYPGIQPRRGNWLIVFHSADGGLTWDEEPTIVGRGHDHPAIAVDLTTGRRKGWIYLTTHYEWRDGNGDLSASVFVARSRDGGRSFDRPAEWSSPGLHAFGEMPVVLSDGTVVASFVEDTWTAPYLANRRGWTIRSTDGAMTFSAPGLANDSCGPPPGFQLSALAVDGSDGPFRDRLYFGCRQSGGGSVVVTSSTDRGTTWNRPGVVVGSSPTNTNARRVMSLAVNNKGILAVLVVERNASTPDACLKTDFFVSGDGGATFGGPQRISASTCGTSPADAIAGRLVPTYGDYFGIVSTPDGRFRLMWPEMRAGASVLLTTTVAVDQ